MTRDPLTDPRPGDVVRAATKTTGARFVFVVTKIADERAWGTAVRLDDGFSVPFVAKLVNWCDWSRWTDVEVMR